MDLEQFKKSFLEKGYGVISQFIDKDDLETLRARCAQIVVDEKEHTIRPTSLLKDDTLTSIIFSKKFLQVIDILPLEYRHFLPNFTVRQNLYVNWHTDDRHAKPDDGLSPALLQCNIYFQDNSSEHGGGIDVACGTQHFSVSEKLQKIEKEDFDYETVGTKSGDLLIFDYRVIHRSTMPKEKPKVDERLALQWTVGADLDRSIGFLEYLMRRQQERLHPSDFGDKRALAYFFDAANVRFPESFMTDTETFIRKSNIFIPECGELVA